jgi:hypothetical protein
LPAIAVPVREGEDRAGEAGREAVISNQQPVISDQ